VPLLGALQASGTAGPWTSVETGGQLLQFYRTVVPSTQFAHPEALASTQWLEQHLGDPSVRIVDSRFPQTDADFRSGHIPGAVKVDPMVDLLDPSSAPCYRAPTPAQFEALMGRLGVSNTTTVVVYDTNGGLWCARLWWALRYYGHEQVKLVQGGLDKWRLESRPLEKTVVLPNRAIFHVKAHPEWRAAFTDVRAAIGSTNTVILDGLSQNHHTGKRSDISSLPPGHIPSAMDVPATSNLDSGKLLLLPPEALATTYRDIGVTPDKEVITYCGGGYYGAFSLFVLYQLGYEKIRLYDGSWADWIARHGAIETGP
jgi:thiosulfate/3-mercaptopyruvate sulfurtransferase